MKIEEAELLKAKYEEHNKYLMFAAPQDVCHDINMLVEEIKTLKAVIDEDLPKFTICSECTLLEDICGDHFCDHESRGSRDIPLPNSSGCLDGVKKEEVTCLHCKALYRMEDPHNRNMLINWCGKTREIVRGIKTHSCKDGEKKLSTQKKAE